MLTKISMVLSVPLLGRTQLGASRMTVYRALADDKT